MTSDDTADIASVFPRVVERYLDAMMNGDAEAYAALFTDDAVQTGVVEDHTRIAMSRATIRSMMPVWFEYVTYTDVEHLNVIAEGNTVTIVSTWSGTSSTHARAASDQTPFSAPVVTVFEIDNGLIARCDIYLEYDQIVN